MAQKYLNYKAYIISDMIYNQVVTLKIASENGGYIGEFLHDPTISALGNNIQETIDNLKIAYNLRHKFQELLHGKTSDKAFPRDLFSYIYDNLAESPLLQMWDEL